MPVDEYIQDKYGNDSPGSSRFKRQRDEIHASQISDCQRKLWWNHNKDHSSDPSIYFELGRMYERFYGRALRNRWGENQVLQDVEVQVLIEVDGEEVQLVGESDWCVLREPFTGEGLRYEVDLDGTRTEIRDYGQKTKEIEIDEDTEPLVDFVIETKTTKKVKWKKVYGYGEDHLYQLSLYMMAMDVPGQIAYIERNDASLAKFDFDRDESMDMDIKLRATQHYRNLGDDELPPATPLTEQECKYCPHQSDCRRNGGSKWL